MAALLLHGIPAAQIIQDASRQWYLGLAWLELKKLTG
jgi:hypothetical protein